MIDKKTRLIIKIKALAEAGVGGEKTNAQEYLRKLMLKYGITEDDIQMDSVSTLKIRRPKGKQCTKLFWQIFWKTYQDNGIGDTNITYRNDRTYFWLDMATSVKLEFLTKWELFSNAYISDLELFYLAFLQKNKLLTSGTKTEEPSEEEMERYIKASLMSQGLDKHSYFKQIEQDSR
jgi:hypothetical protein